MSYRQDLRLFEVTAGSSERPSSTLRFYVAARDEDCARAILDGIFTEPVVVAEVRAVRDPIAVETPP